VDISTLTFMITLAADANMAAPPQRLVIAPSLEAAADGRAWIERGIG
jgi:hypothetical protein